MTTIQVILVMICKWFTDKSTDIRVSKQSKSDVTTCNHLVALIVQNSNQILMDIKNIYEFKDNIEFSTNSNDIDKVISDYIP